MTDVKNETIPFLKWAGGKRWLAQNHLDLFNVPFQRYIEPFLGSGAIFFKLAPQNAILNDVNARLVEAYEAIRDNWKAVEHSLKYHQINHSKDYYYKIRSQTFNSKVDKASQFIYLNRTCWNGLYRVNKKGVYNVPIGTKQNVILDSDNFSSVSRMLKNVDLSSVDFEKVIEKASAGDLIFVDPPYTVSHNDNGFIKYNEILFSWPDQIRLRDSLSRAVGRGAKAIITNAYHNKLVELYSGLGEIVKISRHSVIAGKKDARGKYHEMVIKCL